jgi:hypothetical protein
VAACRSGIAALFLVLLASAPTFADDVVPAAYLSVVVNKAKQDDFLHQLQSFADSRALQTDVLRIPVEDPDARLMTRTQLWNDEVLIVALNAANLCSFELFFYQLQSGSIEQVTSSRLDLAATLRALQGVIVTEADVPATGMAPASCE